MFTTRTLVYLASVLLSVLLAGALWRFFFTYSDLDLLIVNGVVLEGSGRAPSRHSIGIRDGKIVAVGGWRLWLAKAKRRIDAGGKIVAPGFIDVHTHVEASLPAKGAFRPANFLRQGVTTLITGNCGRSRTDVAALLDSLERNGSYLNLATLIGHNSIRREVMGIAARAPSPDELQQMKAMVERAMKAGAFGFSTGLAYVPGRFAQTGEVIALTSVAAQHGGLYVSHIRDEAYGGVAALQEALDIGRKAGADIHISHFKSSGRGQWNTAPRRLELLDDARAAGLRVTLDVYPYDRSSTTTDILLPDWALESQRAGLKQAAQDATARQRLQVEIQARLQRDGWSDLTHVRFVAGRPEWIGKTLAQVPRPALDLDAQIENLIEVSQRGGAQVIYADMHEADVDKVVCDDHAVFGSDSAVRDPDSEAKPHPRGSGTFPRIFRRYVRERRLLSLSQAVRKASGQAAGIFGLEGRGYLKPGAWADVVIFDPATIKDEADYDEPLAPPAGIEYVIVNGTLVLEHGALTNERPSGKALRKPALCGR
ncbi:MAG: N-acyl-D-amino-acid deacylase family protein [Blastocatellia bacterium]